MSVQDYIDSGILEQYTLGQLSPDEEHEVLRMAQEHPEIASELEAVADTLESYALQQAIKPPAEVRSSLLDKIAALKPKIPILTAESRVEDYAKWLDHPRHQPPEDYDNRHVSPFGQEENRTFMIVWWKREEEPHVHRKTTEIALVVEGTCNMILDGVITPHKAGDVVIMRPGCVHGITVTSETPMKAVVMRVAG